jgi:hypothetical protein
MLCTLCASLNFNLSSVQTDPSAPISWTSTPTSTKYYVSAHQPSLPALFASAKQGCHLCMLIRSELFHIRGHESEEERHQGFIDLRVYITGEEEERRSVELDSYSGKQIQAVARTNTRDVRVPLDFMRFERSWARAFTYHMALTCDTNKLQHILNLSYRRKHTILPQIPAAARISSW